MKKIVTIFAVFFICISALNAHSDDLSETARAARKAINITTSNNTNVRQRSDTNSSGINSRSEQKDINNNRERSTVLPRSENNIISDQSRTAKNVSARKTENVQSRNKTDTNIKITERSAVRGTTSPTANRETLKRGVSSISSRTATNPNNFQRKTINNKNVSRAATDENNQISAPQKQPENIDNSGAPNQNNYTNCKKVFYTCMDEFCANKDSQLKRCACSARMDEFKNIKNKLSDAEEKIQDFNQRLVSVNLDAEDAAAMSKATEGEIAYQQDDESASKKMLDEISKKLDTETTDSKKDGLNMSLNENAAFDNMDSMGGSSAVSKEGAALYNAALPICREMTAEICDENSVDIVESSYQMAIEQDCNTVAKAYETNADTALKKISEGSSLLDMSRLNIYQSRNSDDTLTCRKKMLEAIYNSSVCGENLTKCLDITGKYIDPSTGEVFLTTELANLSNILVRPTENQTWTTVPKNKDFITFLESKKEYLEPAMANCQDISENVWDDFMEDALAQIKLAQYTKLEDMRQSCTTLTTECLSDANTSISAFDSRALSIFGVAADTTINEMCSNIKSACTALLQIDDTGDSDWVAGMTDIKTQKTYETILDTCREVGKSCIIKQCTSISGNFGLCEKITGSVNRQAIVTLDSDCWNEVLSCVEESGSDSIDSIMAYFGKDAASNGGNIGNFYNETYGSSYEYLLTETPTETYAICSATGDQKCIYDICASACAGTSSDCAACRITEKIWGNCEYYPTHSLKPVGSTNKILTAENDDNQTLLDWFAASTNTEDEEYNCAYTTCAPGYTAVTNTDGTISCLDSSNQTSDQQTCVSSNQISISGLSGISTDPIWTNCCNSGIKDTYGNCCTDGNLQTVNYSGYTNTNSGYFSQESGTNTANNLKICTPDDYNNTKFVSQFWVTMGSYSSVYGPGYNTLVCISDTTGNIIDDDDTDGIVKCNGRFVIMNSATGSYIDPTTVTTASTPTIENYYNIDVNTSPLTKCRLNKLNLTSGWWTKSGTATQNCTIINNGTAIRPTQSNNNLMIKYNGL